MSRCSYKRNGLQRQDGASEQVSARRKEYDPSSGAVHYRTAQGVQLNLDALEWIALVTQHVPDPGEHTRHYFGYYSNAARGKRRQRAARDGADAAAGGTDPQSGDSQSQDFRRECRRSWARLIQKVYEVDPLVCPDCGARLEIIAFIEAPQAIRRILEHLELWTLPARPPPAPLVQGKIDALTARSSGNHPDPSENADGVFVDDVPVHVG